MRKDFNFNRMNKETSLFGEIIHECIYTNEYGKGYSRMSLKELSNFYDKIEDGLIGFNLVSKDLIDIMEDGGEGLILGKDGLGKYLESQLLSIVATAFIKNPPNSITEKFKESLWRDKLMNKKYYEQVFELSGLEEKERDKIYKYFAN
jgi:hypothetical protein